MEYERDQQLLRTLESDYRGPIHRRKDLSEVEDKEAINNNDIVSRKLVPRSMILDRPGRHLHQRRGRLPLYFSEMSLTETSFPIYRL